MKLLLDESVPRRLKRSLDGHDVRTVGDMGWSGIKNGQLLLLAAAQFDVFVTVDKNLSYQQNLTALPVAVILLEARTVQLKELVALVPELQRSLAALTPRSFIRVFAGP